MNVNSVSCQSFKGQDLNNISKDAVTARLKLLNKDTPAIYTTSFIKNPEEIALRTVARNNMMLEQIIENQNKILENQNKILGNKLDTNA